MIATRPLIRRTICCLTFLAGGICCIPAGHGRAAVTPTSRQADQATHLMKRLLLTQAELGPNLALARYSRKNPACWTVKTAPVKPQRRIRALVRSGAVGPATQLCMLEFIRKNTHDDILIKIFITANDKEARAALSSSYLQRMSQRLARHGLPPIQQRKNLVYYLTASKSNFGQVVRISRLLAMKLRRLGW